MDRVHQRRPDASPPLAVDDRDGDLGRRLVDRPSPCTSSVKTGTRPGRARAVLLGDEPGVARAPPALVEHRELRELELLLGNSSGRAGFQSIAAYSMSRRNSVSSLRRSRISTTATSLARVVAPRRGSTQDLAALGTVRVWDGVVARSVDGDRVGFAVLVELEPSTVVPEHSHENEQLGIVLRGSVSFRVGEEVRDLEAGGTWRIAPNVPHGCTPSPEGAVVIDVFAPVRPAGAARTARRAAARLAVGHAGAGPCAQRPVVEKCM